MKLNVEVGDERQDYAGGDFLNAINEVVYYFEAKRNFEFSEAAIHLKFYAEKIEREEDFLP